MWLLRLTLILFFFGLSFSAQSSTYFMKPQPRPAQGPWFEGWYLRLTDVEQRRSFTVLVSSLAPSKKALSGNPVLPGYIAYLVKESEGSKTQSSEFFPDETGIENQNQSFVWKAPGYGELSEHHVDLKLPNGERIELQMGARRPWSQDSDYWGPGGLMSFIKFLPLHWYIDSLGSPSSYRLTKSNGEILDGRGFTHVEKNWGAGFPKAWIWAQGTSDDNRSHIVLSGGPLKMGPLTVTSFLVGYKSPKYDVEIRHDQMFDSRFEKEIRSGKGEFILRGMNSEYYLHIQAVADPESFANVSIPTPEGFIRNKGKESFSARIKVDLYQHGQWLESQVFEGAALEFGGEYMEQND